jgi:hypothetical protein
MDAIENRLNELEARNRRLSIENRCIVGVLLLLLIGRLLGPTWFGLKRHVVQASAIEVYNGDEARPSVTIEPTGVFFQREGKKTIAITSPTRFDPQPSSSMLCLYNLAGTPIFQAGGNPNGTLILSNSDGKLIWGIGEDSQGKLIEFHPTADQRGKGQEERQ